MVISGSPLFSLCNLFDFNCYKYHSDETWKWYEIVIANNLCKTLRWQFASHIFFVCLFFFFKSCNTFFNINNFPKRLTNCNVKHSFQPIYGAFLCRDSYGQKSLTEQNMFSQYLMLNMICILYKCFVESREAKGVAPVLRYKKWRSPMNSEQRCTNRCFTSVLCDWK